MLISFRKELILKYQIMRLPLSSQVSWRGSKLNLSLRRYPDVVLFVVRKATGNNVLNKIEKVSSNCLTGSASFFWIEAMLKLLSSANSCLRLVKAFTPMLKYLMWLSWLLKANPKNGFATSIIEAKKRNITADLNNCMPGC